MSHGASCLEKSRQRESRKKPRRNFSKGMNIMNPYRSIANQLIALITTAILFAPVSAATLNLPIYADALAAGWSDWSWDSTHSFSNTSTVHGGADSISVTVTKPWGALYFHTDSSVDTFGYDQIQFWVHGGNAGNQKLQLSVDHGAHSFAFTAQAGTWTRIDVPLSALGGPAVLADIWWADASGAAQPTFYLDDIVLVAGSTSQPAVAGPSLAIDVGASRHAISDDIYGINLLEDEVLAKELRLPVRRWGGNATTRYNWQNDTTNVGFDWYFENIAQDNPNPATLPDGSAADRFVEKNKRTSTRSLMTVPMIGWVAKRRPGGHPYDCGFKVSKYGAQQSTDQWDSDCGNGKTGNGANLSGNDPADTSTAVGPSFVSAWIAHLVGRYGTAANGGVALYALDNEPMIWNSTHRDVHPAPPTYDEMRDRTFQYGAAVKAADPSAKTLGPVEWGWCAYLYSGADNCAPGADYQAHGSIPYVAWYLQQMRSYEQQHALRILDYFDLHAYPYSNGVSLAPAGDAATQALRLRSTRALWDPSYIDESWVSTTASGGVAIQLIPRMKNWVADNYPGTKTAITEYNYGGYEHVNGALAQADALGVFGREGLDLATFWGDVVAAQPGTFAFRIYRNYDGAGHGFGDVAVRSTSSDQGVLAVYSAQRSADGALTIMVINKSGSDLNSSVGLAGFAAQASALVYRYSRANLAAIERLADQAVTASGFAATFPANSITLFVIPGAASASNATGLWWNPAEAGWGVNFNQQGNVLFGTLFTYDASGKPLWLVMSNGSRQADGSTFVGDLYQTSGPAFNAVPFTPIAASNITKVGTMSAAFSSESAATLTYSVNGVTVTKTIQPQVFGAKAALCQPAQSPRTALTNYQDLWWNPAESGWGVNITHQDNTLFATLFTYDATGKPLWLVMSAGSRLADGSYIGDLHQTSGPAFNAQPFTPITSGNVSKVGTMQFRFSDGSNGTLSYTVNGAAVSKMITRQEFSSPLPACVGQQ
jgi:hypothetical protein